MNFQVSVCFHAKLLQIVFPLITFKSLKDKDTNWSRFWGESATSLRPG